MRAAQTRTAARSGTAIATRLLLALGVLGACRGGHAPESRPPEEPATAAGAQMGRSTVVTLLPEAGRADAGAPVDEGMPRLAVVLHDPRLAGAREKEEAHDPAAAARALDAARAMASLGPTQGCAWAYMSARLHAEAAETSEASAAFEQVLGATDDAGTPCSLAPYAGLRDAQALLRLGRYDDAAGRLHALGDDFGAHDAATLALADALVMKGDRASALPLWRALLARSPHGVRWADSSLQLAAALLDGLDGPPESRAEEALDLATRVLVEAPMTAEKTAVIDLRIRAAKLLRPAARQALHATAPILTPDERARQAQAWLDASQPKRATETADALLKALPGPSSRDKKHRPAACKASVVRAQAVPHGKSDDAADAWGDAITRCDGEDSQVTALYYGGKASASAHRETEATARFALVEKRFPTHRLADDARFHAAQVVFDEGDEAKGLAMLASMPDLYPDGDMKGEALFRVALTQLGKRDLGGARTALDRLLALDVDDRVWGSAGRAAYYRARVSQLGGDVDDAKTRYTALITDQPFAFYMLLAYARLQALDDAGARAAVRSAIAREPASPFLTAPHPELATPAFDRFARLLEVGEIEAARHEAAAAGLAGDGVDPEVAWTTAWLYDRAGAPEVGHSFGRARLVDYRGHWPAGRWKLAWQTAFPCPWEDVVGTESVTAGIPSPLTWAIMREESAFNPDARSVANALGLMQLLTGTARLMARGTAMGFDEASLRRPEVSIALGARLLGSLRASFAGNPALAIAAYNSGAGAVRRWLGERGSDDFDVFVERIPYDETRNYLKRVLASEAAYAYLYAPKTLDELLALPERASGPEAPPAMP
jgi:soluble lytic murein transglycosylase